MSKRSISISISASDLALIDRAARLRGLSRTAFVRNAALVAADQAIRGNPIQMSEEAFAEFMAVVEAAPAPLPNLVKTLARRAPWEKDDAGNH